MPRIRFTRRADADLDEIGYYSAMTFGLAKADAYMARLSETFRTIADFPLIGRSWPEGAVGMRRFGAQKHVVYYLPSADGVTIVRVLHASMDAHAADFDDEP